MRVVQGDLVLDMSEKVIEFVLKLALNAEKLGDVEIDPSNTSVITHTHTHTHTLSQTHMSICTLSCCYITSGRIRIYHLCSIAVTGYCTIYLEGSLGKLSSHKGNYCLLPKFASNNLPSEVSLPSRLNCVGRCNPYRIVLRDLKPHN